MSKIIVFLCAFIIPSYISSAPTSSASSPQKTIKYVSGPTTIKLRSGQSEKHKVIQEIPIGSELEVIKTIKKYSLTRTKKGTEGWMLTQYLSDNPLEKRKIIATNKILKQDIIKLRNQLAELEIENQHIRHAAEQPLKISDENTILVKKNVSLETSKDILSQELQIIRDNSEKQWFLIGIGTILLGILIGLLLPKLRRRRKSDWDKL